MSEGVRTVAAPVQTAGTAPAASGPRPATPGYASPGSQPPAHLNPKRTLATSLAAASPPILAHWRHDILREPWRYLAALAIVATSTAVAELLYRLLDTTRLSMVFLAGVLVAALRLGAWPGLAAAVVA